MRGVPGAYLVGIHDVSQTEVIVVEKPAAMDQPLLVVGRVRGQRFLDPVLELAHRGVDGEGGEVERGNAHRGGDDVDVDGLQWRGLGVRLRDFRQDAGRRWFALGIGHDGR